MSASHESREGYAGAGTAPPGGARLWLGFASLSEARPFALGMRGVERSSARRTCAYAFSVSDSGTAGSPTLRTFALLPDKSDAGESSAHDGRFSPNCTAPEPAPPARLDERIDCLRRSAAEEYFEPGVESRFAKSLRALTGYYGPAVFRCLAARLEKPSVGAAVLSEALEWASWQDDPVMRPSVVDFLSAGMHHESALVRDAAALGLAHLEGGRAVGALEKARDRERDPELRRDMADLIASLKE